MWGKALTCATEGHFQNPVGHRLGLAQANRHCCLEWLDFLPPVFELLWPIAFAYVRRILACAPSGPSAFSVLTAGNRPQACSSFSPLLRAWTEYFGNSL